MTRWDTDNLNAAHTMRELEQEWGGDGVSDLVKRSREYGDEPQDVSLGEIAEWMHKSSDRIEQLERELVEAREEIAVQSESNDGFEFLWRESQNELAAEKAAKALFNTRRKEAEWEADQLKDQLAAEKALADRLWDFFNAFGPAYHDLRTDYHKARGL